MNQQIEIDFTPGLTQQYPEFIDLLAACVHASRGGLTRVAMDLDQSPGNLSRMLARDSADKRHFPAAWVPKLVESTGDMRPVYWMIEKFLEDSDTKHKRALNELAQMLPAIKSALDAVK